MLQPRPVNIGPTSTNKSPPMLIHPRNHLLNNGPTLLAPLSPFTTHPGQQALMVQRGDPRTDLVPHYVPHGLTAVGACGEVSAVAVSGHGTSHIAMRLPSQCPRLWRAQTKTQTHQAPMHKKRRQSAVPSAHIPNIVTYIRERAFHESHKLGFINGLRKKKAPTIGSAPLPTIGAWSCRNAADNRRLTWSKLGAR